MSVSGELLCSFELLKPLDSSALKSHIKKGRNKRQNMLNSPVSRNEAIRHSLRPMLILFCSACISASSEFPRLESAFPPLFHTEKSSKSLPLLESFYSAFRSASTRRISRKDRRGKDGVYFRSALGLCSFNDNEMTMVALPFCTLRISVHARMDDRVMELSMY